MRDIKIDKSKTSVPKVDQWYRDPKDAYVSSDGKNLLLNMDKILPNSLHRMRKSDKESILLLKTFIIERKLFFKKTEFICQYIDYFVEFFDPDKELPLAYIAIKKEMDSSIRTLTKTEFVKMMMMKFFKDTRIKKNIFRLVEENYSGDVTVDRTGREFKGTYDFTNEEAKVLLAISIFMKFIIPITSHYINTTTMYSEDELNKLLVEVFVEAFYRMGDYKEVDSDMVLVKMYEFTEKQIIKHSKWHQLLWTQQCALRGLTENMHVDTILIKHLLCNNMFKFRFDDNIVSFLKSVVETQLSCTINKLKYKADPVKIDNDKNYSGLTGIDKIDQSMAKMDETAIIRCTRSIEYEFERLAKELGDISGEEHTYYMEHFIIVDPFHKMLIDYFFAKEFGGYTELKSVTADQYVDLMVYAKRKTKSQGYRELPDLLSSNTQGRMSHRLLQNSKYMTKYNDTPINQDLNKNKYSCLEGYDDDPKLSIISRVLNNVFVYNDYDFPEKTDTEINFNEDIISDEIFTFIDMI